MKNPAEASPIIVCGCQRSGTTALVRILNENEIMISNEWALFAWPAWEQQFSLAAWLENKNAAVERNTWLQHWNHKMQYSGHEAELGFTSALHSIYRNRNAWRWGDKWSDYVFHIDPIRRHFPQAKIIYIYRDGRDVVASMLRKGMAKTVQEGFERWVNSINAWRSWEHEVEHLAVRQEDLMQHPDQLAGRIAEYCDFPLLSSKHAAHVVLGADKEVGQDHVSENPFKHMSAYRDQFSDDEIPAEAVHHLTELGYRVG
ncbi:sulfotransferase family protein [Phyllobacterium ifriqiyense]|uniref:sulfotransferase family protein n=1 Tax=Phyllobacterium ifriqiyense TaxID=314238 RepID=UPI0033953F15